MPQVVRAPTQIWPDAKGKGFLCRLQLRLWCNIVEWPLNVFYRKCKVMRKRTSNVLDVLEHQVDWLKNKYETYLFESTDDQEGSHVSQSDIPRIAGSGIPSWRCASPPCVPYASATDNNLKTGDHPFTELKRKGSISSTITYLYHQWLTIMLYGNVSQVPSPFSTNKFCSGPQTKCLIILRLERNAFVFQEHHFTFHGYNSFAHHWWGKRVSLGLCIATTTTVITHLQLIKNQQIAFFGNSRFFIFPPVHR